MHYYQHNIGDYRRDTPHLTLLEHGIYRQLLDWYYLSEEPIPEQTDLVMRRLCARTEEEKSAVISILNEFFKCVSGWIHDRCDREIQAYKAKADRARSNGRLGGRKPKTKVVISGNPEQTQSEANSLTHKPINHKPIKPKTFTPDDLAIAGMMAEKILIVTASKKLPNLEAWAETIRLMRESDQRSSVEIRNVFLWANQDGFWRTNILSPPTLRKQFDKLFARMTQGAANGPHQRSDQQRPDNSVAGEIRRNVAREIAAARTDTETLATHGFDVRPQMGEQLRAGSGSGQGLGLVLEGDFCRSD